MFLYGTCMLVRLYPMPTWQAIALKLENFEMGIRNGKKNFIQTVVF